jgi:hypothetical protein
LLQNTEEKAQLWRAVAILKGRGECLLYVGRSGTAVRAAYVEAMNEGLEEDEIALVTAIKLEQWQGAPDAGKWHHKNDLRVPKPERELVAA